MFHQFRKHSPMRYGRFVALFAFALLPFAALFAAEPTTPPASPTAVLQIGVVDFHRISQESTGYKTIEAEVSDFANQEKGVVQ